MRTIKSLPFLSLAMALLITLLASLASAQDKPCKVKVRIVNFNWDGSGEPRFDNLTANQTEWWLKEGQKKFPGICITTTPKEADYLLAWTSTVEERTSTYTVPKTETTQHRGTIDTNSTSTSTNSSGAVYTSGSGTYRGTSSTTTYEKEQFEYTIGYVNAFVHKMVGEAGERQREKLPIFIAKHKGQWRWSKPDKDAFEKAIKFIAKQSK